MNATRETKLSTLARKMMLTVKQTVALPSAVSVVAQAMGYTESQAIDALMGNAAACEYVASVCRKVA